MKLKQLYCMIQNMVLLNWRWPWAMTRIWLGRGAFGGLYWDWHYLTSWSEMWAVGLGAQGALMVASHGWLCLRSSGVHCPAHTHTFLLPTARPQNAASWRKIPVALSCEVWWGRFWVTVRILHHNTLFFSKICYKMYQLSKFPHQSKRSFSMPRISLGN